MRRVIWQEESLERREIFRNAEQYWDPTAGQAIASVLREQRLAEQAARKQKKGKGTKGHGGKQGAQLHPDRGAAGT